MRLVTSGPTIAVECHGTRSGQAIVLLHGLSSSRLTYHGVIEHLMRRHHGHRVIAVDLRGHGESDRATHNTYDAASYAADIAAVIEALTDTPALVVGHSLGGVVAADLARTNPNLIEALFLEDPPLFEGNDARRNASPVAAFFPKLVAAVHAFQASDASPEEYASLTQDVPAEEREERQLTLSRWDPTTMSAAIDGTVWRNFDPTATLSRPVTIVRADPKVGAVFSPEDAALFQTANPSAQIVEVPGAGHSIHAMATLPQYLTELDQFVEEVRS
jgi:pimeloyl-ACP methyl ester carboxylesterase